MRTSNRLVLTLAASASLALAACGVPANTVGKDSTTLAPAETATAATSQPAVPQPTLEELNPPPAPKDEKAWKQIEQLISEQKLEAAYEKAKAVREAAQAAGNEEEWTRALVTEVQLRTGLHGYETAVRLLKETPWPKGALWRITLQLYYAGALTNYAHIYSWEIGQREKVASQGPIDLKAWTRDEIYAEAGRAFEEVWQVRQPLGSVPLDRLSEYLVPNDYPREVRGTLRDAVSYLRVELLADTAGWRPQHSNETWALDLPALIAGNPAASSKLDLTDANLHPLLRIGAILDDLESWHQSANHPEAQLEARLERLRRLHAALTSPEDREAIAADLEKRLPEFKQVPWWSMGVATLAGFVQEQESPDALVRARELAAQGAERYPESVGGKQCRHIVAALEAPSFSISSMLNDGPQKRSLEVSHKNVSALWMRAYRFDLEKHLGKARDYRLMPDREDLRLALVNQKPAYAWKAELPATPDLRQHRTFVTPPIDKIGAYLVVASPREDFGEERNQVVGSTFLVTRLALVTRTEAGRLEARVLAGETGEPVAGATVTLYQANWNTGHRPLKKLVTGADGTTTFTGNYDYSNFLVVGKDGDLTLDPDYFSSTRDYPPGEQRSVLVYTDRSIYRPAQKILWKAVAYQGRGEQARFQTLPKQRLVVTLMDANYQVVASQNVATNGFGSVAGEFEIPAGRALGNWSINATLPGGAVGTGSVRVEEYKRPTFEVSLQEPKEALRLNREASFTGEARYYFGLPVTSGQVRWRAVRTPVYRWWWWHQPPANEQQVASGTAALGEDGKFTVRFTPKADERQAGEGVSYSYTVSADVVDEGGETRSASRSFRLGFVSVEARIGAGQAFFIAGTPAALTVARSDLNGAPRAGKGSWKLFALAQPEKTVAPADIPLPRPPDAKGFSTPGDWMRSRAARDYAPATVMREWTDDGLQGSGSLEHDAKGEAALQLPGLSAGAYRLRYETTDDFGAKFETQHEFVVADRQTRLALPAVLIAQQSSVKAGEKAVFLAHSGIPDQPLVLELFQAGKRISEQRLRAGSASSLVEIPVGANLRGGFMARLSTVRDWQPITLEQPIFVPWDDRELKVEFSTFRDRLKPGGEETWRVTVRGPAGSKPEAGAAELLAYMYDRSLDLFAPHVPINPLGLYPNGSYAGAWNTSLQPNSLEWVVGHDFVTLPGYPTLQPDALKSFNPYGIGGPGRRYGGYRNGMMRSKAALGDLEADGAAMPSAAPAPEAAPPGAKGEAGIVAMDKKAEKPATAAARQDAQAAPADATQVRSNFAETAFWKPQLLLDADGAATIEFKVPDSVTSWKVWVHALTRDLKAGSTSREAKSVKELMVRPYLPRFVREGDEAELKVVVNNASERPLSGSVDFDILDPATQQSVRERYGLQAAAATLPFSAPAGGSANVAFPIRVPNGVGQVAFKVIARAGDTSDGELRPLPVLPSRVRLAQSRFVTLKDKDRRELRFDDLAKGDDPSLVNESLVVTLDAQLFYSVLSALPYLTRYPYECTEQTLNRFVSTGIVSSVYDRYPAVARMAKEFSKRQTPFETFDSADPNRKIALEETPWLLEAKGGEVTDDLINTLDPRVAAAERTSALAKLRKAQTASGGFPWWPGGPPSPYMTLYLVYGFSKAVEFGVDVPQDMVQRAWNYLGEHYRREYASRLASLTSDWEFLTFLNYAASCYPDESWTGNALTPEERKAILEYSFKHWKDHSPYLKGQLALTLKRADRPQDAKLVFDSVMDSAKTTQDEGTFWAPEDRAWLWYNDTIETHAFALRTLAELEPKDARRGGLVHWLMLNKKLNHWKSTRATAEVIYSLVHYLSAENQLGVQERATVAIGPRTQSFVFEPDKYTGKKNQIVVPGPEIDAKTMSTITVSKDSPGLMFASATWNFSTEKPPAEERGDLLWVSRTYFKRVNDGNGFVLQPLAEGSALSPGDEIEVHLSLKARHPSEYVHLRDPRAAGLEPVSSTSRFKWDLGLGYYEEVRDSSTNFFFEQLPQGEYTFKYRLRAATAGTFKTGPATVQSMYAPEFVAYSTGATIKVLPEQK